jgi:transposase
MRRYEAEGLDGIESDRPRAGRPRKITRKVEEEIVEKTTNKDPPPEESTHWTSRLMGKALRIDHVTIWRVWRKYGLQAASDPALQALPRSPFGREAPRRGGRLHESS